MTLTSKQVEGDIFQMLKDSTLPSGISGDVYRLGNRPRDSRKEDAVVGFVTGLADQIQSGVVVIHIYVPDIDPFGNGVLVEDGARTEEVERLAQDWVDGLTADKSCYKFSLQQTIHTSPCEDIHQHYVVIRLKYNYFDNV